MSLRRFGWTVLVALVGTLALITTSVIAADTPSTRPTTRPARSRMSAPPPPATPEDLAKARMRSPQETIDATVLPPGYHLELVASEPDIISPVLCVWDGNGRMYVAEMRSYMLDINGSHEKQRISRVVRLEDTTGSGKYDKLTVLADKLLLPRMVLPLDDRVLIRETDTRDIYSYRDVHGDGSQVEKSLFFKGGPANGNLEHQASGLMWNIDNWIYTTVEAVRYRYTRGKVETQPLNAHLGQWGIALDDTGRTFFNTAGGEDPAFGFQLNPVYADVRMPEEKADGFMQVFPLLKFTDVQGGPMRLWPGGGLNHFTGCAGGSIYRGDALPSDLYGDYILPEPVGRLIRRAKITNDGGKIVVKNAYDHDEFIRSADANFRPVWTATGPDGCLYICDMYHGIIQESAWTAPGSYLRPHIQKYGLDKHVNGGRIYRLVYDGMKRRKPPHMLDETTAQLVGHLSDPNGWWRDTAQKLIVLRGDHSVVPALVEMATSDKNPLARLHALWTLEGLDAIEPRFLVEKLSDADPRVRAAAVRIAEPLLKRNDPTLAAALQTVTHDSHPNVAIQFCVSLLYVGQPQADALVRATLAAHPHDNAAAVVEAYHTAVNRAQVEQGLGRAMMRRDPKLAAVWLKGRENYLQTCIACHGPDGQGAPVPGGPAGATLAPPLKGSHRLMADNAITARIVLHGLVGPNDNGKIYPGEMAGFPWADDEWLSSIVTYARNAWGNHYAPMTPADLAAVRAQTLSRTKPYTLQDLQNPGPATTPSAGTK